jgi:predicted permease
MRVAWLAMGLAVLVLIVACINLAGLELARLAGRGPEYALRMALGASPGRLVRQALAESFVVGALGGLFGIAVAGVCRQLLMPYLGFGYIHGLYAAPVEIPLDARVLGLAVVLALVSSVAIGLVPGRLSARAPIGDTLRQGGRGTIHGSQPRLRQGLVVAEMAMALVLLTAGGLFLRGLHRFVDRDLGWQVDGLLTGVVSVTKVSGGPRMEFIERLRQRIEVLPGVDRSSISSALPILPGQAGDGFLVEGAPPPVPGRAPVRYVTAVTPGYFATLGIALRDGRLFTTADGPSTMPVVIINEAMARHLWPGQSPIGKRIGSVVGEPAWRTIVGVVSDVRLAALLSEPNTAFQTYLPVRQAPTTLSWLNLALRTRQPPETLIADLRRAVAELDPDLPVYEPRSARGVMDGALGTFSLMGWILSCFAMLGLVLSALGVYGLFSGFVVQRTREIGVRVALGAQRGDVLLLVLGKGLRLALLGAAIGLAGAFTVAPVLTAAAAELPAQDPIAVVVLALILIAVALLACWLPARRAAALDPMVALRRE